jgi:hypothetical protein
MRYEVKTALSVEEIMEKAASYFGEDGLGLDLEEQTACCAHFSGGGGHVSVTIDTKEGEQNVVDLETREWDHQVRQFMKKL